MAIIELLKIIVDVAKLENYSQVVVEVVVVVVVKIAIIVNDASLPVV